MQTPLAITGIGAITPVGETPEALLAGLDAGRSGFEALPSESATSEDGASYAGRVASFDVAPYVPPMKARRLDRTSLFAVIAARQALESAGLWPLEEPWLSRIGVLLGTASAGSGPLTEFLRVAFTDGPSSAPPAEFPNTVANAPASQVSILNRLTGPNTTLSQKQSVIGAALGFGGLWLEDDRCDAALIGAADEWNAYYQLGYRQLGSLRRRPEPEGQNGFLLSEGAVVLLVEPEPAAVAREATVYSRVLGSATCSSPGPTYAWIADPEAQASAIRQALAAAQLKAEDVGSVFVSANGVAAMECSERQALRTVFGHQQLQISGIKGALGDTAAAGVAGVAVAALCRQRQRLCPYAGGSLPIDPRAIDDGSAKNQAFDWIRSPAPNLRDGATVVLAASAGGNYAAVVLG